MHLTRDAIRALLTARDKFAESAHVDACPSCGAIADEVALELGAGDELAWELAALPELPRKGDDDELAVVAEGLIDRGATADELVNDARFATEAGRLALLRAAHGLLNVDPSRLRAIAETLIATAERSDAVAVVAHRERANALRRLGDLHGSLESIVRGREIAAKLVVSEHELAIFDYVEAAVRIDQSMPDLARELAAKALTIFERFGDRRRELYAKLILAALEDERGRLDEARTIFRSLVGQFVTIGDDAASVGALQNAGNCSLRLQDLGAARAELGEAARRYHALQLSTESLRVRWLLARVALEESREDDAERELAAVAAGFDARELRLDAALARLDLVELFHQVGRHDEAAQGARALVDVFAARGARGRLADALMILREAAEHGTTLAAPLREAREAVTAVMSAHATS